MGGETGDGHPGSPSVAAHWTVLGSLFWWAPQSPQPPGTRFTHPPTFYLPPSSTFPKFAGAKKEKVRRPIWPTIDSMQVAVTLPGSETTIVSRWNSSKKFLLEEKLDRQAGAVSVQSVHKASRCEWQKKLRHKRMRNNELLSQEGGKKTSKRSKLLPQSMSKSRPWGGPGWRLVDGETMRPNIEVAVASRNGSYDNDTGCGKGQIERPGTGRRACLLPDQRFNRVVLHVRVWVCQLSAA